VGINKNIKLIINYVVGPLLLLLICYHLYRQISTSPHLSVDQHVIEESIKSNGMLLPLLSFLLMFVQWGIEAWKWKIMMHTTSFSIKWTTSLKMIFAGLSFSFVTPNRLGEFIGRVFYLPSEKRAIGTAFTVYNTIIQISVYGFFAATAFYYFDSSLLLNKMPEAFSSVLYVLNKISLFVSLLCIIFFFTQHRILIILSRFGFLQKFKNILNECAQIKIDASLVLVGLTMLKSIVFIVQYWLIFSWLGVDISFLSAFVGVSLMVFGLVVVPTVSFLEIGLRWEFSYLLFSVYTSNLLGITIGATIIWLLNVALPALIGAFWLMFRPVVRHDK
jgi:hypothetical protein